MGAHAVDAAVRKLRAPFGRLTRADRHDAAALIERLRDELRTAQEQLAALDHDHWPQPSTPDLATQLREIFFACVQQFKSGAK